MTTPDNVTQNTNSPYLNLPKRLEAELRQLRELHRAKMKAMDAYNAAAYRNVSELSEDERIDLAIESDRLYGEVTVAYTALETFKREHPEGGPA